MRQALAVLVLLLPLAGCARPGHDLPASQASTGLPADAVAAHALRVNATAPDWHVGQFWVHKWTLTDGGLTFLVKTVVAEDTGDGWTLAPDNQTIAAFHGAFVFPTLGHFTRGLGETAGGTRWPWYHFPLTANATWKDKLTTSDGTQAKDLDVDGKVASVTFASGSAVPVFHVELSTAGHPVASYDYDPETQWFDDARFYNDTGKVAFHLEMTEKGQAFKGTVYDDAGKLLLSRSDLVVPPSATVQPTGGEQDFTMAPDQNRLLAFLIDFAAGGAHDTELVAPDGTRYGSQSVDLVLFPVYNDSKLIVAPGQPGAWHTSSAGAGAIVSGGVIQAWGLHERAIPV